jgi:rare lipoprotein A (peptidoglycan hydrolase)
MIKASLTKQSGILMIVDTDVMKYGKASWYKFKGCMCAASPDYPKGTMLTVVNKNKNQAIQVRVNDWGPERDIFPERVIDLDLVAFTKFATKGAGVLQNIYVIPYHASDFSATDAKAMEAGKTVQLTVEQIAKLEGVSQKTASVVSTPSSPLTPNAYNLTPAAPVKSTATTQPPTYLWLK